MPSYKRQSTLLELLFARIFLNVQTFLEFSFKISSSRWVSATSEKVNGFTNDTFFRIKLILGWSLYFQMQVSTGSWGIVVFTSGLFIIFLIFRLPTAFLKKVTKIHKSFTNSWSSEIILSLSTRVILEVCEELLLKREFIIFQQLLLSLILLIFTLK